VTDAIAPTYGKCFAGLALGFLPLFIAFGIGALFGFDTVRINRQPVHGPLALIYSLVAAGALAAAIAAFQKLGFFMLRVLARRSAADA
jgi:hypothetical protein